MVQTLTHCNNNNQGLQPLTALVLDPDGTTRYSTDARRGTNNKEVSTAYQSPRAMEQTVEDDEREKIEWYTTVLMNDRRRGQLESEILFARRRGTQWRWRCDARTTIEGCTKLDQKR